MWINTTTTEGLLSNLEQGNIHEGERDQVATSVILNDLCELRHELAGERREGNSTRLKPSANMTKLKTEAREKHSLRETSSILSEKLSAN